MIWLKKISALISVIYFFLWIQACIRTGDGMVRSVSMRNLKTAAEQAARTATRSGSRSRSSSRSGEFGKVPARSHSTPPSQARRRSVSVERPSGQPRRRSPSFSRDISPVRNGNTLSNVKALVERQGFGTSRLGLHTHQTVGSKNAADILLRGGDEVVVQSFVKTEADAFTEMATHLRSQLKNLKDLKNSHFLTDLRKRFVKRWHSTIAQLKNIRHNPEMGRYKKAMEMFKVIQQIYFDVSIGGIRRVLNFVDTHFMQKVGLGRISNAMRRFCKMIGDAQESVARWAMKKKPHHFKDIKGGTKTFDRLHKLDEYIKLAIGTVLQPLENGIFYFLALPLGGMLANYWSDTSPDVFYGLPRQIIVKSLTAARMGLPYAILAGTFECLFFKKPLSELSKITVVPLFMWAKGFQSQEDINEAYDDRYMEPLVETNYMGEQGAAQASMVLFDATVWAMELAGNRASLLGSKLGSTAAFSWAGKIFHENYAAAKKEIMGSKAAQFATDTFMILADKTSKEYTHDQRRFMFSLASNILFDSTHDHNGIKHDHWQNAMDIEKIYEDKLNGDDDPENDAAPTITLSEPLPEQLHFRDRISRANGKPKEIKLENKEVNEDIKETANTIGDTFHALYKALPLQYKDHNHSHLMNSVAEARNSLTTPGLKSPDESANKAPKELTVVDYAQHLWKNMEKDLIAGEIVKKVKESEVKNFPKPEGIPFSDIEGLDQYHPSPAESMIPSKTLENLFHNLEDYYEEYIEEKDDVETDDEMNERGRKRNR